MNQHHEEYHGQSMNADWIVSYFASDVYERSLLSTPERPGLEKGFLIAISG